METRATSLCAQTARHTHDTIRRARRADARTPARRADARARDRARRIATARRRARDAARGDSTERGDESFDDRARDSKSRDSNDARAIRDGRDVGARDGDVGDGGAVFTFEVPADFERYLVDKGSFTIDGISLTVVEPAGRRFDVAVIPHTLDRTHLAHLAPGDPIHLEADLVAKWVERLAR